jgi:hypothetical protein
MITLDYQKDHFLNLDIMVIGKKNKMIKMIRNVFYTLMFITSLYLAYKYLSPLSILIIIGILIIYYINKKNTI